MKKLALVLSLILFSLFSLSPVFAETCINIPQIESVQIVTAYPNTNYNCQAFAQHTGGGYYLLAKYPIQNYVVPDTIVTNVTLEKGVGYGFTIRARSLYKVQEVLSSYNCRVVTWNTRPAWNVSNLLVPENTTTDRNRYCIQKEGGGNWVWCRYGQCWTISGTGCGCGAGYPPSLNCSCGAGGNFAWDTCGRPATPYWLMNFSSPQLTDKVAQYWNVNQNISLVIYWTGNVEDSLNQGHILRVCYESIIEEESYVNTSFESPPYTPAEQYDNFTGTSNNYNIEEEQTASININVTGTQEALNVTYDNEEAIVIYRDSFGFSLNITDLVPYTKTYNLTDENFTVYFDITPLNEEWEGFDASVVWDNHTDDYSEHIPNITVGYRKPIYNVTVNYSSPHYMEEDNYVDINFIPNYNYAKVNFTITPSAVGSDLTPASIEEIDFTGSGVETISVKPNYLNYTEFTMEVDYNSKTQTNSKAFVDSIEKTYRHPLYNLTLTYPSVMYILENSTIRAKLMPNAFYQHAKANVTLKYNNEESKVYFYDDYDQLTPIEVSVPYEKTYYDTYSEINGYFIVTPLTTDYTGYTINAESDNPLQEITFEVNKSEELPDPDYIEIRYKYPPITYPLENKTLMLQFHKFNGNWNEYYQCFSTNETGYISCVYNETNNEWVCQDSNCQLLLNSVKITCRTCGENSTIQLVQYWTNITDCSWFNETLQGIKYWSYPISMILQDKDVCNNYNIVPSVFGFSYRGGIKSLDNRDKYVFYNLSRSDQNEAIIDLADAINVKVTFDGSKDNTTVTDKNAQNMANTGDVYIVTYKIENYKITFYIGNKKKNTIWADVVAVRNLNTVFPQSTLYTAHSGKKINVYPVYTDGIIYIYPSNSNEKIPIEPATGSNSLELIYGEFSETLADIGAGIGSLFTYMGSPLAIFIILLAVGGGIAFILASVGRRVGAKI